MEADLVAACAAFLPYGYVIGLVVGTGLAYLSQRGLTGFRARLRITEIEVFMTMVWFVLAAIGELVGCYSLWTWLRDGRSPWFLLLGTASLLFFAWCLTRTPVSFAGRAFAAYAGVYLVGALAWMMAVDRIRPDRWDLLGGTLALLGAFLIVYGPRGTTTP